MMPTCVLDIETRVSDGARALLPPSDRPTVTRAALLEVTAASTLEFTLGDVVGDFRMDTTITADDGEAEVLLAVDRALARARGGVLVTHNGVAHDVPVCGRRVLHHWLLDAGGVLDWWRHPPGEHVDTMLAFGGPGGRGPSLVDLAAGLGFSAIPPRSLARLVAPEEIKGQVDVVSTAICYFHLVAAERRCARWLADAWAELSRFLLTPAVRAPHLLPLARVGSALADARDR